MIHIAKSLQAVTVAVSGNTLRMEDALKPQATLTQIISLGFLSNCSFYVGWDTLSDLVIDVLSKPFKWHAYKIIPSSVSKRPIFLNCIINIPGK